MNYPAINFDKQIGNENLVFFKKLAHDKDKCVIIVTHFPNVYGMVNVAYDLEKVK